MSEEKKFIPEVKIYAPGDLNKEWYVYYFDHRGERLRFKKGINKHLSYTGRLKAAQALKLQLESKFQPEQNVKTLRARMLNHLEEKRIIWRKSSYQSFKANLNVFFTWLDTNKHELNKESIQAFFRYLLANRHSTTYNGYLGCLKNILNKLGEGHLIEGIENVPEHKTPARYFQKHHIPILIEELSKRNPELLLFVKFIYYCFIRPQEVRHLKAGDIMLYEQKILIRGETSKNRKTQYVAIPDAFYQDLVFVERMVPGQWLFPSKVNPDKPIGKNTMSKWHKDMLDDLGFGSEYKLYSWKHTGAVQLVKAGVGLKVIQTQMRHHSLDQTDQYLRQLGVGDFEDLKRKFPALEGTMKVKK